MDAPLRRSLKVRADSYDSIVRMHDSSPTQFSWSRVSAIKRSAKLNLPLQNSLFHKSVAAFIHSIATCTQQWSAEPLIKNYCKLHRKNKSKLRRMGIF